MPIAAELAQQADPEGRPDAIELAMDTGRHVSHTVIRVVVEFVTNEGGDAARDEMLRLADEDRPLAHLTDDTQWSTYRQLRRLLARPLDPHALEAVLADAGARDRFLAEQDCAERLGGN